MGETSSNNSENSSWYTILNFVGLKRALIGGGISFGVAVIAQLVIGFATPDWEVRQLMHAVATSSRYLATSTVGGASTIIALMLTMLGFGNKDQVSLDKHFYERIHVIAVLCTIGLIAAVLHLQIFSMPITEGDNADPQWFQYLYYVLIAYVAFMAGIMVVIVLMLQEAVSSLIKAVRDS